MGCIVFLLVLTATNVSSQILPFKTYSVKDGLLSNDVGVIYQDSRGYMWFGTTDGISVFDGKTFKNFTIQDGLPKNFIADIFEDVRNAGTMWILAGGHVVRFSNNQFYTYTLQVGSVNSIFQDHSGIVWCGTNIGVVLLDGDTITPFHSKMLDTNIVTVAETADSIMWFGGDKCVISYSPRTGVYNKIETHMYSDGIIWSMLAAHDGNLYAGMGAGFILQLRENHIVNARRFPQSSATLAEDYKGNLWFGGYSGIGKIPTDQFAVVPCLQFTVGNGLPESTVRSLFVDRENNLWVAGRDKGVAKLSTKNIYKFSVGQIAEWAKSHDIPFAASDSNNHVWLLADNSCNEYWRDQYGAWHTFRHQLSRSSGSDDALLSLSCDKNGKLWLQCGGWPGRLECYSIVPAEAETTHSTLELSRTVFLEAELSGFNSLQFMVDDNSEIWQSFGQLGIVQISPTRPKHLVKVYGEKYGIPTNYIRALARDHFGNIWGGGYNSGVVKILREAASDTVKRFGSGDGLPDWSIWCIMEDRSGKILIGTANGGLGIIEGDSVRTVSVKNGLPSNSIRCMTEDSSGRLWLGTSIGMVYEDLPGSKTFLENQAFIGSNVYNCGVTGNGLVWFATSTDLFIYDYLHDTKDTAPPPIHITGFKSNSGRREIQREMKLSHEENNCEISFIGISFKDEGAIRYRYRLAGADENWQGPTYNTSITYGHLDPGSYTFEVKAINIDGTESKEPATLAITILSPYWQTWWFYLFAGMIVLAIGPMAYWRRTKKLLQEQHASQAFSLQLIESQEAERKRVAGELHDGLGQELIVIANRAQMALRSQTDEKAKEQIRGIAETAGRAIENVRDIAFNLSPYHLEQLGLTESLKSMIAKVHEASGIQFTVDIDIIDRLFLPETEINIYRMVQECVNNILKHAHATAGSVIVKKNDQSIDITVHDNGKGFDISKDMSTTKRTGYGLTGLAERIKVFHGSLHFDSTPGGGTTVHITLAYPRNDEK